jgi:hypothetical protein
MSNYPKAVYKAPGTELIDGKHFTSKVVTDDAEHEQALDDGWHDSAAEADEAYQATISPEDDGDKQGKPTRAELEQKATDLGIKFRPQTSDTKLLKAIEERLASSQSSDPDAEQ